VATTRPAIFKSTLANNCVGMTSDSKRLVITCD